MHIITPRLASDSQKYCRINPFYRPPTYYYLRLGMSLSVSPTIWEQFIDRVSENIPNRDRYKSVMDDAVLFSSHTQKHFEDLGYLL